MAARIEPHAVIFLEDRISTSMLGHQSEHQSIRSHKAKWSPNVFENYKTLKWTLNLVRGHFDRYHARTCQLWYLELTQLVNFNQFVSKKPLSPYFSGQKISMKIMTG